MIQAFKLPLERPDKLMLTTGEVFPASRLLTDEVEDTEMEGVEHLGQYVFEMTQAKMEMSRRGEKVLPSQEAEVGAGVGILNDEEEADSKAEVGVLEDEEMDSEGGEIKVEEKPDKSELDEIT